MHSCLLCLQICHPIVKSPTHTYQAAPLYATPIALEGSDDNGLGSWVWSSVMKEAMMPVLSWTVENLILPTSWLNDITDIDSLLQYSSMPRTAVDQTSSENLGTSSGCKEHLGFEDYDGSDSGCDPGPDANDAHVGSQPFQVALMQLQWTSSGAVMPLKYEMFGRILFQVGEFKRALQPSAMV